MSLSDKRIDVTHDYYENGIKQTCGLHLGNLNNYKLYLCPNCRNVKIVKELVDLKKDWKWYKKKPILIKATELEEDEVWIETREGILKAYKGDFIIQGIEGEIYPCAKHIFFKTYEEEENGI